METQSGGMTIREFARLVLPLYRQERWRWSNRGRMVVPTEARIIRMIQDLIRAKRKNGIRNGYRWTRSGGICIEWRTPKRFGIWFSRNRGREIEAEIVL